LRRQAIVIAHHTQSGVSPGGGRRDLAELAIGYALILATVWAANPAQRWFYWTAFAWMILSTWLRSPGWAALGMTTAGFLRSLWVVGVAVLGAGAAIAAAHWLHTLHRLHGPTPLLSHVWGYLVWAVMQQFLLQSYFLWRLLRIMRSRRAAVLAAASLFAIAHIPNPVLTPVTLVWGVLACMLFLRYRNIYTLGIAHGILGLALAVTVPNSIHHHMRVGLGYLRYKHPVRRPPEAQRSHTDHSVSTEACVTAEAPTRRS
jgi:hypothetical protein